MKKRIIVSLIAVTLMVGMAVLGFGEDCISFNPKTIKVKKINNSWKIVDGNHWMFDFGSKRAEAVKAYRIIKHYRMNQSCFVGRPDPSFQYLLVNGRAPMGSFPGEDALKFNPHTIEVKKIGGRWKIVDGSHWMFDFAGKKREAFRAFRIIKKYGFNRTCYVGRPGPSFKYLTKVGGNIKPLKPVVVKPFKPFKPIKPVVREDCVSFNPYKIRIKKINGRYKIVEGSHWIFDFGSKRAEAIKRTRSSSIIV